MKWFILSLGILFSCAHKMIAQEHQNLNIIQKYQINYANKQYNKGNEEDAIKTYNSILTSKPNNSISLYNLANSEMKKGNVEDSRKIYDAAINNATDKSFKSKANYNVGNGYMQEEKWEDAIKYYKNALKQNPHDDDARYNLAYANAKLKQQQQDNKDNKDNQENKDQQDQKDQQQNQDQQEQDRQQKQQQQPRRMSKEEAERNMKALRDKEKKLHQKNNDKESNSPRAINEKDW